MLIDNWSVNNPECSVDGCNSATDQAIAVVSKKGRNIAGRFSQFGKWKTVNGSSEELTLFPEYEWVRWITRCDYHFTQEMKAYCKQHGIKY